ncbi:MAG: hypothetical protein ACOCU8_01175 [Patescibacteria group bacterium]
MSKLSLLVIILAVLSAGAGYWWTGQSVDNLIEIDSENNNSEIVEDDPQNNSEDNNENNEIVNSKLNLAECLAEAGVVIYGSRTCPACARLVEEYGGYENMKPIYVECRDEPERCNQEMLVDYVPAVQINGEIFEGWASPEVLAEVVGCQL